MLLLQINRAIVADCTCEVVATALVEKVREIK